MSPKIIPSLASLALFVGLALPTVLPEVSNITMLVLMVGALLVLSRLPDRSSMLTQPAVRLLLLGTLPLALAVVLTARSPEHILALLVLAPLFLVGPLAALLAVRRRPVTPATIGMLALIGTAGAAAVAGFDVFVRGLERGGSLVNNPIHLADLAMTLGFVALVGLFERNRPLAQKCIFLLGPVLALSAGLLSGSRGPLLAMVPMAVTSVVLVAWLALPRRSILPIAAGTVVLMLAIGAVLMALGLGARMLALGEIGMLLNSGSMAAGSIGERFYMYLSAWNAFQAAPWFGHGLIDYAAIAASYAPPDAVPFLTSGHLHNDIADFAVIGGVFGLVTYAAFMLAPVAGGIAARGLDRPAALFLGSVTSVGYVSMGLTNAMIGILTQTVLYAVVTALVVVLARGREA